MFNQQIENHFHVHFPPTPHPNLEDILMKVSDIAGAVTAVSLQLDKAKTEIIGKLAALEAALSNVELPAEALDDVVPDPTPEPVAGE